MRDDLSGALYYYTVTYSEVLGVDVVLVVERGAGDRGAADIDRIERGVGVYGAGAPDVEPDVHERGDGLLGRELVGYGPPGFAADLSQVALVVEAVDLDDQAVAAVIEVVDALSPVAIPVEDVADG